MDICTLPEWSAAAPGNNCSLHLLQIQSLKTWMSDKVSLFDLCHYLLHFCWSRACSWHFHLLFPGYCRRMIGNVQAGNHHVSIHLQGYWVSTRLCLQTVKHHCNQHPQRNWSAVVMDVDWTWKTLLCVLVTSPTLYDPTDCSGSGSSVHEILQARIL